MKKILLLSVILIIGCEETTAPTPTHGCLDGQATNYDATASIDNNSCTYIDSCGVIDIDITNDCIKDCAGEWGGISVLDDCSVCDTDTSNDNTTCEQDCAGVSNGSSYLDECGGCDANVNNDCIQDCAGEWGGISVLDDCGVCNGDGTSCEETVAGNYTATTYNSGCSEEDVDLLEDHSVQIILNSDGSGALTITKGDDELLSSTLTWTASGNLVTITYDDDYTEIYIFTDNSLTYHEACIYLVFTRDDLIPDDDCDGNVVDECGVCGGDGIPDGACNCSGDTELDCAGVCGGDSEEDICGVCHSNITSYVTDYTGLVCCDELDECGVCGGDNSPNTGTCDCVGTPNGAAVVDACGVCDGDGSTCNISYSSTIQPIFNNNCTGCHGSSGGLNLGSYSSLMNGGNSGAVVISGNGSGSRLIQKLQGTASGSQMPKNQSPLDDATINLISSWIDQGALDN